MNLVRYPSASTARLLVLLAAILSAGLYAGNWLHTLTRGEQWFAGVQGCEKALGRQPAGIDAALAWQSRFDLCTQDEQRLLAAYSLAGAAGVALVGLAILLVAPTVLEHRRRLRPVDTRLHATTGRTAVLAHEAGLRRPPQLMLGTAGQRDAFSYGAPTRGYRIALPRALAVRPRTAVFEAVLRHELAHLTHHDVPLAWLARSLGYALAVLLGVPLLIALIVGDRSLIVDYVWRSAVLAGVVLLARAAWLRSREHDADLRAAKAAGDEAGLLMLLDGMPDPVRGGAGRPLAAARRLLANHPLPSARAAALREPQRTAPVTFVDGLTVAFLAGLTQPLLTRTLVPLLTGQGMADIASALSAALVGPLLGATVGLGLWRQALVGRLTGVRVRVGGVAMGVFAGLLLGRAGTLAEAGSRTLTGTEDPLLVLIIAVAGAGATVIVAGLGELWADAAGRLRRVAGSAVPAVVLAGLLFGVVLWASTTVQLLQDGIGWRGAGNAVITVLAGWPVAALALLLAAAVAIAGRLGRPGGTTPDWLLDRGPAGPWSARPRAELGRDLLVGLVAGLAGGTAIVGYRVLAGPAAGDAEVVQRYFGYLWVAAAMGAVTALVLGVLRPSRGAGVALLAGPVAVATAQACFLAQNAVRGGGLDPGFAWTTVSRSLAIGLLLQVAVLVAAVVRPVIRPGAVVTLTATAALAVLASVGVLAGRDLLVPAPPQTLAASPPATTTATGAVQLYVEQQAPQIEAAYGAIQQVAASITAGPAADGPARAARIRAEVVAPLGILLIRAEQLEPADAQVAAAHRECIAALHASIRSMQGYATGFDTGDPAASEQAWIDGRTAISHWRSWQTRLVILRLE